MTQGKHGEPKIVELNPESDPSAFRVMITPVDATNNRILRGVGFSGESFVYTLLGVDPYYSTHDFRKFAGHVGCDGVKRFLGHMEGSYEEFEYGVDSFEELADGEKYIVPTC
jgi:hypothetical protein